MKKTVYAILIISLLIGLPLMLLDALVENPDDFNIPARFKKEVIDLGEKARIEELIFTNELETPSSVEFFIQSDTMGEKNVKVISESEILGRNSSEIDFHVGRFIGNSRITATLVMDAGKYSIYLTSEKTEGKIVIGYQDTAIETSEFERLSKIHNGELNNPPKGYKKLYSTDLKGRICKDEIIYTLSLDETKGIGLSVYISSEQGKVTVDFVGKSNNYFSLVHADNRICDQLETTLPEGEYQFKLSCENADGQLYVFLKQ